MIYFESSVMRHSDNCQSFSPPRSRTIEIIFSVIKITKVEYLFLSGNPVQLWDQSKMFAIINKILDWFKSLFWKEGEEELANRENICLINNFNKLFRFQRWSWPLWDCSIQVRSLRLLWSSGEFLICSLLRRQNNFRECYRCKLTIKLLHKTISSSSKKISTNQVSAKSNNQVKDSLPWRIPALILLVEFPLFINRVWVIE